MMFKKLRSFADLARAAPILVIGVLFFSAVRVYQFIDEHVFGTKYIRSSDHYRSYGG